MAVDSTIHANEITFKDAIKKMATKAAIAALKAETEADLAELKADVERMAQVTIMWMVGVGIAVVGIIIAVLK